MHHFVLTNDLAQVISENPLLLMDSQLVFWYLYIVQLHIVLNLILCSDIAKNIVIRFSF